MLSISENDSNKDRIFIPLITSLSIVIPLVVGLLMILPKSATPEDSFFKNLPLFHAFLNGSTAILLITGFILVLKKKYYSHRVSMISAFFLSSLFLVSYVVYHFNVSSSKFGGEGFVRGVYFFILITHIFLAVAIIPLALTSIYRSFSNQFAKHKKIARWTLPIWLYVAITGVVIYLMMKPYYI